MMPISSYRTELLLFDLDGTLVCANEKPGYAGTVDSGVHAPSTIRERMKERAIELGVPRKAYRDVEDRMAPIYNKTRDVVSNWEDKKKARLVMGELNKFFIKQEEVEHKDCTLMPDSIGTLRYFKKRGARIGVVTSTSEDDFLKISKTFGIIDYVDAYITRDQVSYVKPHHEPVVKILKKFGLTKAKRPRNIRKIFYVGNDKHDARSFYSACKELELYKSRICCNFILINTKGYDENEISYMRPEGVIRSPYELMFVIPDSMQYSSLS